MACIGAARMKLDRNEEQWWPMGTCLEGAEGLMGDNSTRMPVAGQVG